MIFDTCEGTLELTPDDAFVLMQDLARLLNNHYSNGEQIPPRPITIRDGVDDDGDYYVDATLQLIINPKA